jgi:23S rRNA (pseudouridine1915-N3)-methyltransferase
MLRKDKMKITFLVIGKTEDRGISDLAGEYFSRIRRYVSFEFKEIPALRNSSNLSKQEWKLKEGEKILQFFQPGDHVVLLDERGREMTSLQFSAFLSQKFNAGIRNLWFVTGGPYGFDDAVKKRADFELSLSRMTFPHQLVRLFFAEQLYRGLSILKNESYHHE